MYEQKIWNRLVAKRKIIYRKARIFRCAKLAENRFAIGLINMFDDLDQEWLKDYQGYDSKVFVEIFSRLIQCRKIAVGCIINYLKDKKMIQRSISAQRTKRKRNFNKHANLLKFKKYEDMVIGGRVQIDHMTVTKNGIRFKHFQAWERKSNTLVAQIYSRARSSDAKKFLQHLLKTAPYKILSIQVDGGSEFMGDFEEACAELKISLEVLPPATPKYNGGVERANKTLREEFYADPNLLANSLGEMRFELQKAIRKYNEYRPHAALNGLTPSEYISAYSESTSLSHFM